MLNFIKRQWKNIASVLFIISLLLLALSGLVSPVFNKLIDPVVSLQTWINERVVIIYDFFTIPRDAVILRSENNSLKKQISNLETEIIQLRQDLKEAEILYALLGFARGRPEETYVAASVIGKDPSPFMRYILIDKGSDDGLRYNMPVVTEKGLVGRISAVTASAARVQLISDSGSVVNATIPEIGSDGIVTGTITGDVNIGMVAQDATLRPGQIVQTSGLGGNYPPDIIIGQILNINKQENELFQSSVIHPAEDYKTLQAVLIIANFRPSNVAPLE